MPTYGDNKVRTMARSALRTKRRKAARDLKKSVRGAKRNHERNQVADLYKCGASASDVIDDFEDFDLEVIPDPLHDRKMREIVADRREADALSSIERWADEISDRLGDCPQSRHKAMSNLLGGTLAGRHAMTHIETNEAYDRDPTYYGGYRYRRRPLDPDYYVRRYLQAWELYYTAATLNLALFNEHCVGEVYPYSGRSRLWRRNLLMSRREWLTATGEDLLVKRHGAGWNLRVPRADAMYMRRSAYVEAIPLLPEPISGKLAGIHDIDRHMASIGAFLTYQDPEGRGKFDDLQSLVELIKARRK